MTGHPAGSDTAVSDRREFGLVVVLLIVGSALLFLASSRGWVTLSVARSRPLADLKRPVSGAHAQPLLTALAVVGLAAVVALLATRRAGRQIVGALVTVVAVVVLVWLVRDLRGMSAHRAKSLLDDGGPVVGVSAGARVTVDLHLFWVAVALTGAVMLAIGGLAAAARGRGWPAMGSRYDRPRQTSDTSGRSGGEAVEPSDTSVRSATAAGDAGSDRAPATERRLWEALDRGEDPTAGEDSG
ncbi:MAG TPA: Trp biosynthesis-associated membrane protein [Mycobacteriales bacterium]|jgi:uncharacterized membrane protein (TIGR02234 family)|nr:Trp biosynthesis-associated membrane protein [Mycobacteriales bacterium]